MESSRLFCQAYLCYMLQGLYDKAAGFGSISVEEGVFLYHHAPLAELVLVADELRKQQVPHGKVTWQQKNGAKKGRGKMTKKPKK